MKALILLGVLVLSPLEAFASGSAESGWKEVVESSDGRYSLAYDPEGARVDITKLDGGASLPAEVKLKVQRTNATPVDLRLKALDSPDEPIHYTGSFEQWNGSVMGFEVEMSFDRKTWKKVGRFFGVGSR